MKEKSEKEDFSSGRLTAIFCFDRRGISTRRPALSAICGILMWLE